MTFTTIASIMTLALATLTPSGCHKTTTAKSAVAPATPAVTSIQSSDTNTMPTAAVLNISNGTNCFLGDLTLTNHTETLVKISPNRQCYFKTKMIDSRNAMITLSLENKKTSSRGGDLAVTQIITKSDKPFEVALGNCSLSFTPHIVSE